MDYKGYKLPEKVVIACKRKTSSSGEYYQGYVADSRNAKQIASAKDWAETKEYGPYNPSKLKYEYVKTIPATVFEFENTGFEFELCNCAGGSSQGGKLSFWNCWITKDDKRILIGIDSEMLLDILKVSSFEKGKCKDKVCLLRQGGKVGVTVIGSPLYNAAVRDENKRTVAQLITTSSYEPGDIVSTLTGKEIYLGKFYSHYKLGYIPHNGYWRNLPVNQTIELIRYKKPKEVHYYYPFNLYKDIDKACNDDDTSEIIRLMLERSFYGNDKKSKGKRVIEGHVSNIEDIFTEFRKNILEKLDIEKWNSWYYNILLFLSSSKDDYELPEIVKKLVEHYDIRTVEEEEE